MSDAGIRPPSVRRGRRRVAWITAALLLVAVVVAALVVALVPVVRERVLGAPARPVVATAVPGPRPLVVVAGPGATLRRVDPVTGEVVGSTATPGEVVRALAAVVVDGRVRIATGDDDGTVRMRDLETGEQIGDVLGRHDGPVTGLVATRLAYRGETVARPEPYDGGPGFASVGPDGVREWDAARGTPVADDDRREPVRFTGTPRVITADTEAIENTYGAYQESLGTVLTTSLIVGDADGAIRPGDSRSASTSDEFGRAASSSGGVTALTAVQAPDGAVPAYGDPRGPFTLYAVGYGDGSVRVLTEISYAEQLPMTFRRDVARGPVVSLRTVDLPGADAVVAAWADGTVRRTGPTLAEGPVATTVLPAAARGGYAVATAVVGDAPVVVAAFADGTITRWAPEG